MLGDPGADSQHGTKILQAKSARVKVYKTSDKALWAFTLIGPVPEGMAVLASDWPEKYFSGQSDRPGIKKQDLRLSGNVLFNSNNKVRILRTGFS